MDTLPYATIPIYHLLIVLGPVIKNALACAYPVVGDLANSSRR